MKMKNTLLSGLLFGVMIVAVFSCSQKPSLTASGIDPEAFDSVINGKPIKLYTINNDNGMEVSITNFGGRVVSIVVPNKDGQPTDVVLGYDNLSQYADSVNSPSDFGAAIGRYANRINLGKLTIDGDEITLPQNNFGHCLHGGPSGWQYQVYTAEQPNDSTLILTMDSPDGDNNFPGNVQAKVTYTITHDNSLDISYSATTDKPTVVNMTNHSYFNLSGDPSKDIEDCVLYVNADNYTPSDSTFMTTGEIASVEGTPVDFREPTPIAKDVNNFDFEQIRNASGFDHNWCLNTYKDGKGDDTQVAASLYCPESGILLEVYTDEPGIQVYTGNFLDGTVPGKKGIAYAKHAACCLETQKYPDSPNKKDWPSAFLWPGENYSSHCVYKFGVQ